MSSSTRNLRRWAALTIRRAAWAPIAVFSVHAVAVLGFNAYQRFPPLDIPMHFFGGVAIAFFFHRAILTASECGLLPHHAFNRGLLVFALTCSTTVLWEFCEFMMDYTFGTNSQLGLEDTLLDMLLGTLGGVALVGVTSHFMTQPRAGTDGDAPRIH